MSGIIDLATYAYHIELKDKNFASGLKGAEDNIGQASTGIQGKLGGMATFLKTSVVAGIAAVGVALGAMAVNGVKNAMELDDTMAKFRASTGLVGEESDKVKETIKDLFKVNEDSYQDLANMAEGLHNNMQMNADDIKKYGQNYLDYAKVTKQGIEESIGAMDDIGDAWSLANDEVLPIMDKLKYSQEKYGLSVQDGQSSLTGLAASFKGLGMGTDQAIGYLNLFASTGVESSTAMTAFNYALKQVKSPAELQKAIKDIQSTENATERAKKAVDLFGARAGIGMSNALKPGTQSIEEIMLALDGATGAVGRASKEFDGSLKVQVGLLKKQFQGLFTELGDKLSPLVSKFVGYLQVNMPAISSLLTGVFDAVGSAISNVASVVMPLLEGAFRIFTNEIIPAFKSGFEDNNSTITSLATTMLNLKDTVLAPLMEGFKSFAEAVMPVVRDVIKYITENIIPPLVKAFKFIYEEIIPKFAAAFKEWMPVVGEIIKGLWDIIKPILNLIVKAFENAFPQIKNAVTTAVDIITNVIKTVLRVIKGIVEFVAGVFTGDWKRAWEGIKQIFTAQWEGIKGALTSVTGFITKTIDNMIGGVKKALEWLGILKKEEKNVQPYTRDYSKNNSRLNTNNLGIKSYDIGSSFIPYDQLAFLHKGEAVIPAKYNNHTTNNNNNNKTTKTVEIPEKMINIDIKNYNNSQFDMNNGLDNVGRMIKRELSAIGGVLI